MLGELIKGNARFASGKVLNPRRRPEDFRPLAQGQKPGAIILGCADSRVPPELLFDLGVGDLFVIRIAGNVFSEAGAVKGSLEYAVAELNVPLIFVLGHSDCGAVKSAIKHLDGNDELPESVKGLVGLVKPAVTKAHGEAGDYLDNAIRANVLIGMERISRLVPLVQPRVKEGTVKVTGGVYDLSTGKVDFIG
jgi:carbonic anhydrase